jgi:hypothetical protein
MGTIDLKQSIIDQLSHIDDISFLSTIKSLVESKAKDDIYVLSEDQKERINSARLQLKNNQTINNDILQKEMSAWLNSK